MNWIATSSRQRGSHHHRKCTHRTERPTRTDTARNRTLPRLEWLEERSLRSTVPLSGFPASGFRSGSLEGTSPWPVAFLVDGLSGQANGYDESSERLTDAPALTLNGNESCWVAGIIGDTLLHGAVKVRNDVDFYRIDLPAGDHYALTLRAIAGRIGSPLDPALSLFDSIGQLLASNDDSSQEGALSDSELRLGLDGGTYYIGVSAGGNLPSEPGGFDPLLPGSGIASRGTMGPYLLQASAVSDTTAPEVVAISLPSGGVVTSPLTTITVQFSESMDPIGLMRGASLVGPGGAIALYASSYDPASLEVTYLLNDRPVSGDYVFTLHAADVVDRAGNPIAGNAPGGGYALQFAVDAAPLNHSEVEPNDTVETAQSLGPLYHSELRSGVVLHGAVDTSGDQDFFRFRATQQGFYTFRLRSDTRGGTTGLIQFRDAQGNVLGQGFRFPGQGSTLIRYLRAGEYIVQLDATGAVPTGGYTLTIQAANDPEVPLVESYSGPTVSAVLSSRDGERTAEATEASSQALVTIDAMTFSVRSMPSVGSQPAGRPEAPRAGNVELAWVDVSGDRRVLPDGIVLRQKSEPDARYSVASVSGSFLEPLRDTLFDGDTSTEDSPFIADLHASFRAAWANLAPPAVASDSAIGAFANSKGKATDGGTESSSEGSDDVLLANAPAGVALGMVASLGAVGSAATPNRRRNGTWVRQTFEWLGIES
jgi:hypothetical protein